MKFDDIVAQIVDEPPAKPKKPNIRPAISIRPEDSEKLGELVNHVFRKTKTKVSKSRVLHQLITSAYDSIKS
jgi:hypothetical protein